METVNHELGQINAELAEIEEEFKQLQLRKSALLALKAKHEAEEQTRLHNIPLKSRQVLLDELTNDRILGVGMVDPVKQVDRIIQNGFGTDEFERLTVSLLLTPITMCQFDEIKDILTRQIGYYPNIMRNPNIKFILARVHQCLWQTVKIIDEPEEDFNRILEMYMDANVLEVLKRVVISTFPYPKHDVYGWRQ